MTNPAPVHPTPRPTPPRPSPPRPTPPESLPGLPPGSGAARATAPGTVLVRAGLVAFALGVVAIVATFIGYAVGDDNRPLVQNLLCLLAPAGFGLALIGLVRNARADARQLSARYPSGPRPAFTRLPRPEPVRVAVRWVAVAEATSWLLLIVATVVKYVFGQPLGVQILGPVHGTLFLAYLGVAAVAWWSLRWSVVTVVVVVVDSFLPGGGFLVARRRDLRPAKD